MKITRPQLKKLIVETIQQEQAILLEMPHSPIVGQEQERNKEAGHDDGHSGDEAKRSLFHMSQQAQQLHDMLQGDENLEPWVYDKILKAADSLEKVFKAITYDKGPGQGHL